MVAEAFRVDQVLGQWHDLAAAESNRHAVSPEQVDVPATVAERVDEFRRRHPECTVHEEYAADIPAIESEGIRIAEIVDNLVENAILHAGGGKWLGVTLSAAEATPVLPATATVNDNIPMQYDFRSVYATLMQNWFPGSASRQGNQLDLTQSQAWQRTREPGLIVSVLSAIRRLLFSKDTFRMPRYPGLIRFLME